MEWVPDYAFKWKDFQGSKNNKIGKDTDKGLFNRVMLDFAFQMSNIELLMFTKNFNSKGLSILSGCCVILHREV